MALPVLKLPISTDTCIKQGDTIPKITLAFANEDVIDLTGATIKMQLYLGGQLVYTAVTGTGITHTGVKSFEIDKITQTSVFPEGVLKGDLQITDSNGDTDTYFNIELTISKQYTV